jgi:hypothetical protein
MDEFEESYHEHTDRKKNTKRTIEPFPKKLTVEVIIEEATKRT